MKRQIRKLNLMVRFGIIDPDDFYCITTYKSSISLQGKYNSTLIKKLDKWEFRIEPMTRYIEAYRKGITVTLTE